MNLSKIKRHNKIIAFYFRFREMLLTTTESSFTIRVR